MKRYVAREAYRAILLDAGARVWPACRVEGSSEVC